MRLTLRGYVALGVLGVAAGLGVLFGPRELPSLLAPVGVALGVGIATVAARRPPAVSRRRVATGTVGEERRVTVELSSERPETVALSDRVAPGLEALDVPDTVTVDGETPVTYRVSLEERGIHTLGPLRLRRVDTFGLVSRVHEDDQAVDVVVTPALPALPPKLTSELAGLMARRGSRGRGAFERVREYQTGDQLRDVAWRATGKRPPGELLVEERQGREESGPITLAVTTDEAAAEEALEVTAGVLDELRTGSTPVGLELPTETVTPGSGPAHWVDVERALAATEGGQLSAETLAQATVVVRGSVEGVVVEIGSRRISVDPSGDAP